MMPSSSTEPLKLKIETLSRMIMVCSTLCRHPTRVWESIRTFLLEAKAQLVAEDRAATMIQARWRSYRTSNRYHDYVTLMRLPLPYNTQWARNFQEAHPIYTYLTETPWNDRIPLFTRWRYREP